MPSRCNRGFLLRILLLAQHVSGTTMPIQELKSIIQWLLPVVFRAVVFKSVCCGAEGYVSTPDQQLENHSTKYHRQQPLYNTLELLMMDIVMPETC